MKKYNSASRDDVALARYLALYKNLYSNLIYLFNCIPKKSLLVHDNSY